VIPMSSRCKWARWAGDPRSGGAGGLFGAGTVDHPGPAPVAPWGAEGERGAPGGAGAGSGIGSGAVVGRVGWAAGSRF